MRPPQVPWLAEEALLSVGSLEHLGFSDATLQRQTSAGYLLAPGQEFEDGKDGGVRSVPRAIGASGMPGGMPESGVMHDASSRGAVAKGVGGVTGGGLETEGITQTGSICRTEIAMVAVDARGVEHTLRSWTVFDGEGAVHDHHHQGAVGEARDAPTSAIQGTVERRGGLLSAGWEELGGLTSGISVEDARSPRVYTNLGAPVGGGTTLKVEQTVEGLPQELLL